jgi:glycosyltransferase involved in cell wall biosynthesis/Tfp pilus assembly protein PilF
MSARGRNAKPKKQASKKPLISACMIVKNEEEMLPKCLESIKEVVDEVIVVDTGSSDRTVEIAEAYGAKVYHHPWENDFSKHRNQSISYASSDWIFVIDADEELMPGSGEEIRKATQVHGSVDAIFVRVECEFDEGRGVSAHNSLRLFRNNGLMRYKGRVHNEVVGEKNPRYAPQARIFHYGYNLGAEMGEKKFKRTTELLKLDIEDDPDDPRPHHYLAVSYLAVNMFKEAAREAEVAIQFYKKKQKKNADFLKSFFVAAMANINLDRFDEAEPFALEAIQMYPKHLDSHFALSWIYLEQKKLGPFWHHLQSYFDINKEVREKPEQFGAIIHTTLSSLHFAHFFKAYALLLEGKHLESAEELRIASSLCTDQSEVHLLLGRYYRTKGERDKAEREFIEATKLAPRKLNLMWDLFNLYRENGDLEKQEHWLQKIIGQAPDHEASLFALGVIHLKKGDFGKALGRFSEVLMKSKHRTDAMVNASICLRKLGRLEESLKWAICAKALEPNSLEVLANLATCYYETTQYDKAAFSFSEMAELYPEEIDAHVYLSKLHLEFGDLESCVKDCDQLMKILGLTRNITLLSIGDLGTRFIEVGRRLVETSRPRLGSVCFEIAVSLGQVGASDLLAMANSLISTGAYQLGIPYLEKAAALTPSNTDLLSRLRQLVCEFEKKHFFSCIEQGSPLSERIS